jgi:hypothetical protein
LKSSATLRESVIHVPTPVGPVAATTIWTRLVCGFSMTVPTGRVFDQM